MRVHALARMLGISSKEVLAVLGELGVAARSPQSSIDRSAAVSVQGRLVEQAETGPEVDDSTAPTSSAPAEQAAAPAPQTSLFSAIVVEEPAVSATDSAAQTPLFLQPQVPEEPRREPGRRRGTKKAVDTSDAESVDSEPASTGAVTSTAPETTEADTTATGVSNAAESQTTESDSAASGTTESGDTELNSGEQGTDDDSESGGGSRRRRRGRRGRGRGRGDQTDAQGSDESGEPEAGPLDGDEPSEEQAGRKKASKKSDGDDEQTAAEDAASESASDGDADAGDDSDDDESGTGTRRRRRRRRRRGGSDAEDTAGGDDPPNTVVHEREPRAKSRTRERDRDEVQGISGSTRLEAKRQRRRDGRDAGRRRPPILTESEFLARREAVNRVMVVRERAANARLSDDAEGVTEDYTQVAVLEDGVLVEHFVTTSTSSSLVGNIFLGRVQNVLPGMEAAFVDIGRGRNGVLYAGEVNWDAAGLDGGSRKIEQALKPGDPVVVQVNKDPVGHKGARLTTQISLAGRYLVYVPGGSSTGISRKLPDVERRRLKQILSKLVPDDAGVIIRTASEGVSAEELSADIDRLKAQWEQIEQTVAGAGSGKGTSPQVLYSEPDLLVKVVRDLFNEDFSRLVIDGDTAWRQVHDYVEAVAPDLVERLERFERPHADAPDSFVVHRVDEQLAKALDRKVWLPSGGTLIIEHTEAMTVVDVNTGKFTGSGGNLEETVTRNNLEAAEEIVRQMRLRDIGGMIIVDFIDMVLESNRDLVLRRLTEALSRDRTRHQVSEVTSLGLVQMTRKRLGTGLLEAFSSPCSHCNGRGIIVHATPVEVRPAEEAPRAEGGKRARRGGKRKGDNAAETKSAHSPAEHPMFRAMASHDHDAAGIDAQTAEPSATEAPTTEAPTTEAPTTDAPMTEVADVEAPETVTPVGETPRADAPDTGGRQAEAGRSAVNDASAGVRTSETDAVAPTEAPPTEESTSGAATRPRRRRAARRPAAAPVAAVAVAGTVEAVAAVVSSGPPVTTVGAGASASTGVTVDESVVAVRRRPRRRAAGRPAGPPVED
ncbi:translation initiation factor IF-2 N-terminal domain-containing protein [Williamsia sp. CHRR-6]|nr:translation initiation factor IF-2 N-terminal domain-containing protein [Williamsia sp. CHRR-6]MBT0568319.1 translation initiation factor IF-2 N-terminal domain-containing protein [Williamsia sp. CHRR-6]